MVSYCTDDFNTKELGSFYQPDKTSFKVFAPAYNDLYLVIEDKCYQMDRDGFCFTYELAGDQEGKHYHFIGDKRMSFTDPFAYAADDNGSIILDERKFITEKAAIDAVTDPLIYEVSVRDFSADSSYPGLYKKKFLALSEGGLKYKDQAVGLDYLQQLGITHVQLMPVLAFDNDRTDYNWGYNPLAYNYVQRDYLYQQNDPYSYVNELRETVNVLHLHGLRVTLDLVFNHVYSQRKNELGKMLDGGLYRYKANGAFANGTWCGNEVKSEDPFVRAYILEMCERYAGLFDIDGIRLDLMGIMDLQTVNMMYERLSALKPGFMVYGEGWNMGDVLPVEQRAAIVNAEQMENIAMFNDFFRETIIHYVCGNDSISKDVKEVLSGDNYYLNYKQSLNYVECHDNYTFFDRMMYYLPSDPLPVKKKRCLLALALVVTARGIPFIHMGEEFYRSKEGVHNSYNSGDRINSIKWDKLVENIDACHYLQDLIRVRKTHDCFSDPDAQLSFREQERCLIYRINELMILINPEEKDYVFRYPAGLRVIFADKGCCDRTGTSVKISAFSLVICET